MKNLEYEWEQKYHENTISCKPEYLSTSTTAEPFDATYNMAADDYNYLMEPRVSSLSIVKPVKRRSSRACKKAPTTLLTANADNFRALVQQFTGCHSTFGANNYKGPINLSFSRHNSEKYDHKQLAEEYQISDDQSLFSFSGTDYNIAVAAAISTTSNITTTVSDHSLISVPSTGNNSPIMMPHDDQLLTTDDIEMVNFSLQELQSELGYDYPALQPGISNIDEFWGY